MDFAVKSSLVMLTIALMATGLRLIKGPTLFDRVVALDLVAMIVIAMVCVVCVDTKSAVWLDAATVLALLAFLSTIVFARASKWSRK